MTVTLPFGDFERPKPRSRGPWVHGPRLTDRDVEILRWITRHGVVTTELVGRKFSGGQMGMENGRRTVDWRRSAVSA